jgi:hypothetical protein
VTAEVIAFTGDSTLDFDPDRVLELAKGKLTRVSVIGVDKDGCEYAGFSSTDPGAILWDIERAKLNLLRLPDEEE